MKATKVRIGNQEYEGVIASFAMHWQAKVWHADDMRKNKDRWEGIYGNDYTLRYKETIGLIELYYNLLPKEAQCQLLVSRVVKFVY